jgi:hypothetical protein
MKTRNRTRIVRSAAAVLLAASEAVGGARRCLAAAGGLILGGIAGAAEPDPSMGRDRVIELRLDTMSVHLEIRDGKVARAFAVSPLRSLAAHNVECRLSMAGSKLDGEVAIAGPPSPGARSPLPPVKYAVHAVLGRRTVSGTYERPAENGRIAGQLRWRVGPCRKPAEFRNGVMWMEIANGMSFSADYSQSKRRVMTETGANLVRIAKLLGHSPPTVNSK